MQPYVSGNIQCPDNNYHDTVMVFDYRNLIEDSKWEVKCAPNVYQRVLSTLNTVDKSRLVVHTLPRESGTQTYTSAEIINELIMAGIVTLEKPIDQETVKTP